VVVSIIGLIELNTRRNRTKEPWASKKHRVEVVEGDMAVAEVVGVVEVVVGVLLAVGINPAVVIKQTMRPKLNQNKRMPKLVNLKEW